ncbi:MAG: SPOR domain-containing protein [Sulfuricurvum sp.]|nr:SPOR domain-containing protein [Sulfuricurvum sp.]
MEEKNELNDIILNKGGSGSNGKKMLLAIATLTLILIIVLVIMNSLKSQSDEKAPHAVVPPTPSAPTEVIDDPLFEPVEVIQEGGNQTKTEDLGKIAEKIKQESFQNTPVQENTVQPAPVPVQPVVPAAQPKPVVKTAPAVVTVPKVEPKPVPVPAAVKTQAPSKITQTVITPTIKTVKSEPKKIVAAATATEKQAVTTPKKTVEKPVEKAPIKATETPKVVAKASDGSGTYFIQVGSFAKQPNQSLIDRLNASGLKYSTVPSGNVTKVLVGPFQGEKAAHEQLGNVRKNIQADAFPVKG